MGKITIDELRLIEPFADLPDEPLQWLLDNGEYREYQEDESMMKEGEDVDEMICVVEGRAHFLVVVGGQQIRGGEASGPHVTALLPYSRLKEAPGNLIVLEKVRAITLHRSKFPELERVSHELVQRLVGQMTNRVREGTKAQQQMEKMSALGKMSAGIAHELNNPASSIIRNVSELKEKIVTLNHDVARLLDTEVTSAQLEDAIAKLKEKVQKKGSLELSVMEKSELEDEIVDWLEDKGMEDAFELAESFVTYGIVIDDLEEIGDCCPESTLPQLFGWFENSLTSKKLIAEIEEAAKRISELVKSVKTFSHMDRGLSMEPLDVHQGITSTVTMLNHKLKKNNVELQLSYEDNLPLIDAYAGELNQVWTNLIDNAIDAMEEGGVLKITSRSAGNFIEIDVEDNGSGIPEDIQTQIFEPFFTTKSQGKGTGLGLDIVHGIIERHNGQIKVKSKPGKTIFNVCMPALKENGK